MGYYSQLKTFRAFRSKYYKSEIDAKLEEFKESHKDDPNIDYIGNYIFFERRNGRVDIECTYKYDKHYADKLLAEFISTIIDDRDHCLLEFVGEDGSCWGYLVLSEGVFPIRYIGQIKIGEEIYTIDPDAYWIDEIIDKIKKNRRK